MVAGAALLLQSWRRKWYRAVYDPPIVRSMLSSRANNTASANPPGDRIGVMPDLRAVIEAAQGFRYVHENYRPWVCILFGLIDDTPGVIWIPGRGPVPVDPEWRTIAQGIGAAQRDLLAALAVHEITSVVSDQGMRERLAEASVAAMHSAVDQIARARARAADKISSRGRK